MSQTINSKVAARIGLAEPDSPGSASPICESPSVLDPFTPAGDLSDAISVVTVVYRSLAALEILRWPTRRLHFVRADFTSVGIQRTRHRFLPLVLIAPAS